MSVKQINEAPRVTPVVDRTDVIVVGGGPAGVAAALSAARRGASVRLIEAHGQLGGVWTSGLLSWVLDWGNKDGIMQEIRRELDARGAAYSTDQDSGMAYDPEQMKGVLERACLEAGVKVRLLTRVVACTESAGRLDAVITESASGREAFAADVFVDASGNGDLAAAAGCAFEVGRPSTGPGSEGPDRAGETQPMSLMALVTGIDEAAIAPYVEQPGDRWGEPKTRLAKVIAEAGGQTSYSMPTIFPLGEGLYAWMIHHAYRRDAMDAQDLTDATLSGRAEVLDVVAKLRATGGVWSRLRVVTTAACIGVREGRRVRGRYRVSVDDLIQGARHEDAVCRATFCIDVHSTNPAASGHGGLEAVSLKTQPYDIPYRALVAADVSGLLLAGRCISGDFLPHASYRVTGNAVAMGEAAGFAAAACVERDLLPESLDYAELIKAPQP
jgi:hypothetical protein